MLRSTTLGLVSVMALGVGLASPAGAMGGHMGGSMGHMGGNIGGNMGGSAIHGGFSGRSDFSAGRFADHDMGRMRTGGDHDRDHRDHDRDRFRFFPAFAFGVDGYDGYDSDCWTFHRVWTRAGWRLHRYWACD